MLCNKL